MSASKTVISLVLLSSLMIGCASTSDPSTWSAEQFYTEAKEALDGSDYQTAIKYFEDLEIYHPFSPFTQQAQLEVAYTYYKYNEPDSAIAAADRYIKLYPRADNVDYAYYLRGLAAFDRGTSGLDLAFDLDTTKRQPNTNREAYRYFEELITRFPESEYTEDAKQRMIALRNRLAEYELHVADYYIRRGAYLSAANRAGYVLQNYPQTPAIPDTLVILIKAYIGLEITDLAADALKILKLNYPDHDAIQALEEALHS